MATARRTNVNAASGRTQVNIEALVGPNASVAVARHGHLEGYGDAKRNKGEVFDHRIAADLAAGRALISLGETLIQDARERLGDA